MLPGTRGAAANHRGDLVAVADVNVNADVILARMMEVVQRLMLSITTTLPMMTVHAVMPHWLMRRVASELIPPRAEHDDAPATQPKTWDDPPGLRGE